MKIRKDKSFKESFKEKWNKFEVIETETNRYPFRFLLAFLTIGMFVAIFVFLMVFDPSLNEYPNVSITLTLVAFISLFLSLYFSYKASYVVNKVFPYNPAKTQKWREKQDEKTLPKDIKELYKE